MSNLNFPWKKYSKDDLDKDFNKLKEYIDKHKLKNNIKKVHLGQKVSNNFFQYERFDTPAQNKISCVNFWKLKQDYIIYKYVHRKQHYQNTIQFLNHCPSQFPPSIAGLFYKHYEAKSVFDPYAGWGDRCIAAMALDIDYIGCESNIKLKKPYKDLIRHFKSTHIPKVYFDKSENVIKKNKNKKFDLAFTSPPFWDKDGKMLEVYNKSSKDYEIFLHNSLIPVFKYCMQNCKYVCFHLPPNMYKDLLKYFKPANRKIVFTTSRNSKSNTHSKEYNNNIYCWVM